MKKAPVAIVCIATLLAIGSNVTRAATIPRHAWVPDPVQIVPHHFRYRCTPERLRVLYHTRSVCATDDGGRHWRLALVAPGWEGADVESILYRSDPKFNIVSFHVASHSGEGRLEYWTRDGGRHWWRTDVFDLGLGWLCWDNFTGTPFTCTSSVHFVRRQPSDAGPRFVTTGQVVDGRTITPTGGTYLLEGWPPLPGPIPACPVTWSGAKGRLVCDAPTDVGFRAVPVG
jgi:hypothetical protein